MDKILFLSLIHFLSLEILKIKKYHMVANKYSEVIEPRRQLLSVDVLEYEEVAEYAFIDHYGAALYEEGGRSLIGAGVT